MFSLIITIISIALVAALAVATIYYGGAAFTEGSAKAQASALVAAAQQTSGANVLYNNDHAENALNVAALVGGTYLSAAPSLPTTVSGFEIANGKVSATVSSASVCLAVVKSVAGVGAVLTSAATAGRAYDCFGAGPSYTFAF
jgi:hypothetical protein